MFSFLAHQRALLVLLIAYAATGVFYSLATPPFEASDEAFHYPVVRNIALGRGLPIQHVGIEQPWEQEGSQPPAYYLLSAALTFWIDTSDYESVAAVNPFARLGIPGTPQNANHTRYPANALTESFPPHGTILAVRLIRFLSLLMGVGTVAITYLLALTLYPPFIPLSPPAGHSAVCGESGAAMGGQRGVRFLPLLSASLVAFNPMFLFISASVNNDCLIWLAAATTLVIAAHMVRGPSAIWPGEFGERRWEAIGLGLLLGLAALTKISGLTLIPVTGVALFLQSLRTHNRQRFLVNGTLIAALILLIAGWWYARNVILYGELLGLNTMVAVAGVRKGAASLFTLVSEWRSFWYSYWGLFGAFTVLASEWVYGFFTALVFVSLGGGVFYLIKYLGACRSALHARWSRVQHAPTVIETHLLLILFILLTLIAFIRWDLMTLATQGRLIFTAIAPLSIYMARGLLTWIPPRHSRVAVGAFVGVLGFVALTTAARDIAPKYIPPAPIAESQLPADVNPVHAALAPEAELIGYKINSTERLAPGDNLIVTLYWRALARMGTDYNLFLHVLGRKNVLVGSVDTWPGGGLRPTTFWQAGEIYPDTYVIKIDPNADTPSLLRLDMALWQSDSDQPITITDASGNPIPSITVPVGLLDSTQSLRVSPQTPAESTFEGGISLLGYDRPREMAAGQPAPLVLYWQTTERLNADYTVFVHVRDAAGQLIAQADGPPLDGDWPTSAWQPNYPVIDPHTLVIPFPGRYEVRVGLYDPATVIPLVTFRADGSEWPDRAIELGAVLVK